MNNKILITGSGGLIGSTACYLLKDSFDIVGIDNNTRKHLFGESGCVEHNITKNVDLITNYQHHNIDIRDRAKVMSIIKETRPQAIIHTAAQPSHDLASKIPFDDFDINATGTLNLLESARKYCWESPFIFLSTNKVYGDNPNKIKLKEGDTRWEYDDIDYIDGITEKMSIDQCMHSLYGASKTAADVLVQEYGRYFNMPTCCLRGGCLTGSSQSGVELHGFLNYFTRCCKTDKIYYIYGYNGKQVRDNIHAEDVVQFISMFINSPTYGQVYNIGGGKHNSVSILELKNICESITGKKMKCNYIEKNRKGDHVCYYSDLAKLKSDYPEFKINHSINDIVVDLLENIS